MVLFVPLGGFLGAGKTTTMLAAGRRLEQRGHRVSVITNDQGVDLVDTELARESGLDAVEEVTGGCFCCRFEDLATVIGRLKAQIDPTVILAEAVGSCTDLQATVLRPLRTLYGDDVSAVPLTVVVDPNRYHAMSSQWHQPGTESDLAYLFRHQLDEADIIALNKTDLMPPARVADLTSTLSERFPHATVVSYSASTGAELDTLINAWTGPAHGNGHRPFEVDYDRYGAAEAELAWTNQTFTIQAAPDAFSPTAWALAFLDEFSRRTAATAAVVGHVKIRVVSPSGAVKASLTQAGDPPSLDQDTTAPAREATATLNARVQATPQDLERIIDACAAAAHSVTGAPAGNRRGDIFQPSYPMPVHRM
jgi:G3E family GTPase